jgi:hypothetical protein
VFFGLMRVVPLRVKGWPRMMPLLAIFTVGALAAEYAGRFNLFDDDDAKVSRSDDCDRPGRGEGWLNPLHARQVPGNLTPDPGLQDTKKK